MCTKFNNIKHYLLLIVAIVSAGIDGNAQESLVDRYKDRLAYDVLMRHQEEGGDILEIYVEELKKKYKNIPDYVDEDGKKWVSLCQPEIDPYSDACYVDSFMRPMTEADEDRFYEQWMQREDRRVKEVEELERQGEVSRVDGWKRFAYRLNAAAGEICGMPEDCYKLPPKSNIFTWRPREGCYPYEGCKIDEQKIINFLNTGDGKEWFDYYNLRQGGVSTFRISENMWCGYTIHSSNHQLACAKSGGKDDSSEASMEEDALDTAYSYSQPNGSLDRGYYDESTCSGEYVIDDTSFSNVNENVKIKELEEQYYLAPINENYDELYHVEESKGLIVKEDLPAALAREPISIEADYATVEWVCNSSRKPKFNITIRKPVFKSQARSIYNEYRRVTSEPSIVLKDWVPLDVLLRRTSDTHCNVAVKPDPEFKKLSSRKFKTRECQTQGDPHWCTYQRPVETNLIWWVTSDILWETDDSRPTRTIWCVPASTPKQNLPRNVIKAYSSSTSCDLLDKEEFKQQRGTVVTKSFPLKNSYSNGISPEFPLNNSITEAKYRGKTMSKYCFNNIKLTKNALENLIHSFMSLSIVLQDIPLLNEKKCTIVNSGDLGTNDYIWSKVMSE